MVSLLSGAITGVPVGRKLTSWIESFLDFTSGTQSPERFRRWAAVATIAGALERKVWVRMGKRLLYPNMYILLIGGPGVGKTDALREVENFWEPLAELRVAPSSVSRASLSDALFIANRSILRPTEGTFTKFNSLQVCAAEFGTFLTMYETEFMSTLNHLYDCVRYTEKKRSMKEPIEIPNPQLNIVAATTPAWLSTALPETAWAEGFSSRLLMVFSQERIKVNLFEEIATDEKLQAALVHDLQAIHALWGQFRMTEEFANRVTGWYMMDCPPIPDHPKLAHYLPRRHTHLMKIAQVMSVQRSDELVLRIEDFQEALNLLLDAEAYMPDVFKSMTASPDANIMDEAFAFLWALYAKEQAPISEHRLIHFISQRAPSYSVNKILEMMIQSNMIQIGALGTGLRGKDAYIPVPRATHGS